MSRAFSAEHQIYPWLKDLEPELVLFVQRWDDEPSLVAHLPHDECLIKTPHLETQCGWLARTPDPLAPVPAADLWPFVEADK